MNQFTTRFAPHIAAVLTGWDRLMLTGMIRHLCCPLGMSIYLRDAGVLLKDFGEHVIELSEQVKRASLRSLEATGASYHYLPSCNTSKEEFARRIAQEQGIVDGHVCTIGCVESCKSFDVRGNRQTKHIEVVARQRRCMHIYSYRIHPVLGWMNIRLQTWFPFRIQICLNGREWLARQLQQAGLGYEKADNCFTWIEDFARAQQLMDQQLKTDWPTLLGSLVPEIHPLHPTIVERCHSDYYWSCQSSELARDVVFADRQVLERLVPNLLMHGITTLNSPDVLRFLGRTAVNRVEGDVNSTYKTRFEGTRIKHYNNGNSVKMYDKATSERGSILRFETTINNEENFKVYRAKEGGSPDDLANRTLRRGTADFPARAKVSEQALDRYMNALASVANKKRLSELLSNITRPAIYKERPARALRPFSPEDMRLFDEVSRGEFTLSGLRNKDLAHRLFPSRPESADEARRRSGCVTRKLRLLCAHNILRKCKGSSRYHITPQGREIMTAILTARDTPVEQLLAKAA